jgi:hypothetical protein
LAQIEQGDYSEFEDWETVKKRLWFIACYCITM